MNIVDTIRDRKEVHVPMMGKECYSYPIPDKVNGNLVFKIFTYMPDQDSVLNAGYPNSLLEIDKARCELISYNPVKLEDDKERLFLTYKNKEIDILNNKERLLYLFNEIEDMEIFSDNISSSDLLLIEEYVELLLKSVPPKHIFYYRKFGKEFFSWVDRLLR